MLSVTSGDDSTGFNNNDWIIQITDSNDRVTRSGNHPSDQAGVALTLNRVAMALSIEAEHDNVEAKIIDLATEAYKAGSSDGARARLWAIGLSEAIWLQPEQPAPFARHPHDTPLVSSGAQVWCEGCGKKADRHLIRPERQKSIPCAKWSRTGQRCCACAYALGQNDGGGSDRSNALSMPISSVSAFACSPRRAVPPPPLRPL